MWALGQAGFYDLSQGLRGTTISSRSQAVIILIVLFLIWACLQLKVNQG